MGTVTTGIVVGLLVVSVLALPSRRYRTDTAIARNNFVGDGTNELATAILQGYVDTDKNLAFSPLGYSALLAILAEGARGETRQQLVNALHLPEDAEIRRTAYKNVLQRLTENNKQNRPEFRNWFYIYKNFSVEPDYKQILQENYLTEVKDVDRLDTEETKKDEPIKISQTEIKEEIKPEKSEESIEKIKPENAEESIEKMKPEKAEENIEKMKPEKPEENIEKMKPEKSEENKDEIPMSVEDSKIPEKMEDTMNSEKVEDPANSDKKEEAKPEKSEEKIPEKMEELMGSDDSQETMQLSDVEAPSEGKKPLEGRLQFAVPPPVYFDPSISELKINGMERQLNTGKESRPFDGVITMQQEMLGDKKDKMEEMKDEKKEDKMEEMKDEKKEQIKEDKKENIMKEEMKDDKKEGGMKEDAMEEIKDNKKEEVMKEEEIKEDKKDKEMDKDMKDEKSDKIQQIKEDLMESVKKIIEQDKKDTMKDDMNNDKMEADKKEPMKDEMKETMEAMKDEKKDDKMENMKGEEKENKKGEMMDENKENQKEGMSDEEKGNKKEGMMEEDKNKEDSMNEKEKDKKDNMKDEIKEVMAIVKEDEKLEMAKDEIKEEIKKDEAIIGEKDKKDEDMLAGVLMEEAMNVNPMKEEKLISQAMKEEKEAMGRDIDLYRPRRGAYLDHDDVTSSLSGNNIVAKSTKSSAISQILVFNGMYYKGTWKNPFTRQKEDSFYKSDTEKSTVTMMGTQGKFRAGTVADLDSVAIELPYKGDRYSLLVVMPNSRNGLRQLISDLTGYPLTNIQKHLEPQEVEVCLPKFEIQTTTKPIEALNKFGVNDVFNQDQADLSGISKDSGLFVEELVQLVTVRVDEGSGAYNHITASNPSTRTGLSKFVADHPFLYFVRDTVENIIVVAGKVVDPSIIPEDP